MSAAACRGQSWPGKSSTAPGHNIAVLCNSIVERHPCKRKPNFAHIVLCNSSANQPSKGWFALARVALAPPEHKTAACHSLPMQLDALPNGRRFPGPFSTLGRSCPCNNFLHRHFHEQRPLRSCERTIFFFSRTLLRSRGSPLPRTRSSAKPCRGREAQPSPVVTRDEDGQGHRRQGHRRQADAIEVRELPMHDQG